MNSGLARLQGRCKKTPLVGDAEVPEIHPWFHRVIPQIAESDLSIIGLFLTLDRQLHNYRAAAEETGEITAWEDASQAARVATQNAERAANFATIIYSGCHKTLDALEQALRPVLGS